MKTTYIIRNSLIYNLYFNQKISLTEISKRVNLSVSQVSRILSIFPLYKEEKATRKENNHKRHIEKTKEYIKNKRKEDKAIMEAIHFKASLELSFDKASLYAIKK